MVGLRIRMRRRKKRDGKQRIFLKAEHPKQKGIRIGNTMVSRGIWDKYLE